MSLASIFTPEVRDLLTVIIFTGVGAVAVGGVVAWTWPKGSR